MISISWLDSTIAYFSPRRGFDRLKYRAAYDVMRNYDAGDNGRLNSGWRAVNQTAQQTDRAFRDTIKARGRDLERNSDIAESILNAFIRNVVGEGFTLQALVQDNPKLNDELETLFEEWCKPRNCDVTGAQSFAEICQMAVRRMKVDGGIIFLKRYTSDGIVPFSLQAVEVDDLDNSMIVPSNQNHKIVDGIELNEYNKPVAYYIKQYDRFGLWAGQSARVDAKDAIYLWKKKRPTQVREMSEMASTISRVRDVNSFLEAVSIKEKIAACLAVFITTKTPRGNILGRGGAVNKDNESNSPYAQKSLTPGMIAEIGEGEDIKVVAPNSQASSVSEFVRLQQRLIGGGQGLSYEAASRDMSQVNYSSARQGRIEDIRTYEIEQEFLVTHFLTEVYETFLISAVLCGAVTIKGFWQNKKQYMKHEWTYPGYQWIDPLKEAQANALALQNCQTTLAEIAGSQGYDWKELVKQRALEIEYMKSLGIEGSEVDAVKPTVAAT